tara:strand:- start:297 stop:551 length:255 start_codon:yes stop_codon:yes gene_type:complete
MSNKPIEINEDCQFMQDLEHERRHKMALYNLALAKGQLMLFNKGIKPSRHWRLKDVKWYFGMDGNKKVMLDKITKLQDVLNGGK